MTATDANRFKSLSSDDEDRERFKLDFLVAVEIRYRALLDAGRRMVLCVQKQVLEWAG